MENDFKCKIFLIYIFIFERNNFSFGSKINLCDFTESNWVTLFQDQAECILETTSQELGALKSAVSRYFNAK